MLKSVDRMGIVASIPVEVGLITSDAEKRWSPGEEKVTGTFEGV